MRRVLSLKGVLVGVVLIALILAVVYFRFMNQEREDDHTGSEEQTLVQEVVGILRSYEEPWSSEDVAQWDEREGYPFDFLVSYVMYTIPRFEAGKEVMRVGDEVLYTDDFNYYLFLEKFSEYSARTVMDDETLEKMVRQLIDESVLLQEAHAQGWVVLDDSYFNAERKEYRVRNEMVTKAWERAEEEESLYEGERIAIYFYNNYIPEMGLNAAKEIAFSKITSLHERLVAGTITFTEAAEEIRSDPVLLEIDSSVKANAYAQFTIGGSTKFFMDSDLQENILSYPVGEVSDVLTGTGIEGETETYYVVSRLTTASEGYGSVEEWMSEVQQNYMISSINN